MLLLFVGCTATSTTSTQALPVGSSFGVPLISPTEPQIQHARRPVAIDPHLSLSQSTVEVSVFVGGSVGTADGQGTEAQLYNPTGLALDSQGNFVLTDSSSGTIRKVTPDGVVSTIAGGNLGYADGKGREARFHNPYGVVVDSNDNIYVADSSNHRIRKITSDGTVTTLAGSRADYADGKGEEGRFNQPQWLVFDNEGNLLVSDKWNHRIRKVTLEGRVSTLVGTGLAYWLVDGPAASATLQFPAGLAADSEGHIFIADSGHRRVRHLNVQGVVQTFSGSGSVGFVDGDPTEAKLGQISGVAVDAFGNLFVSDSSNYSIRKIDKYGRVTTLFGDGHDGKSVGSAVDSRVYGPRGLVMGKDGNLYVADAGNHRILKVDLAGH